MSQNLHTVIHSFSSRRYGYRGELSRQGPPLSRRRYYRPTSQCQYPRRLLTTVLGRVFHQSRGRQAPSYSIFFHPTWAYQTGGSSVEAVTAWPWEVPSRRLPTPSPCSTKDTRWQTFPRYPSQPSREPAPAPCLERTKFPRHFCIPGSPPEAATLLHSKRDAERVSIPT